MIKTEHGLTVTKLKWRCGCEFLLSVIHSTKCLASTKSLTTTKILTFTKFLVIDKYLIGENMPNMTEMSSSNNFGHWKLLKW